MSQYHGAWLISELRQKNKKSTTTLSLEDVHWQPVDAMLPAYCPGRQPVDHLFHSNVRRMIARQRDKVRMHWQRSAYLHRRQLLYRYTSRLGTAFALEMCYHRDRSTRQCTLRCTTTTTGPTCCHSGHHCTPMGPSCRRQDSTYQVRTADTSSRSRRCSRYPRHTLQAGSNTRNSHRVNSILVAPPQTTVNQTGGTCGIMTNSRLQLVRVEALYDPGGQPATHNANDTPRTVM